MTVVIKGLRKEDVIGLRATFRENVTVLPPHGDLIDRDAFMKKDVPFNGHWDENDGRFHCYPPTYMQAVDDIRAAPTIIEAEEVSE